MKKKLDKLSCCLGHCWNFPDGISGLLNNFILVEEKKIPSCWLLSYGKGDIVMIMSVKLPCGYHVNDCKLSTEREAQC
jgi:hypothetical protein